MSICLFAYIFNINISFSSYTSSFLQYYSRMDTESKSVGLPKRVRKFATFSSGRCEPRIFFPF
jgi:hypothetical protein